MAVVVLGSILVKARDLPAVRPLLKALVEAARRLDGGYCYDAAEDVVEPGLIRFSSVWPDCKTLDAHFSSPHVAAWRQALANYDPKDRAFIRYDARDPELT